MIKSNLVKSGFTLIELIVVIAILAVLSLILVPNILNYIQETRVSVCSENTRQLNIEYQLYLQQNRLDHSELFFNQFVANLDKDICPYECTLSYLDEQIQCSQQPTEPDDTDTIPFLFVPPIE